MPAEPIIKGNHGSFNPKFAKCKYSTWIKYLNPQTSQVDNIVNFQDPSIPVAGTSPPFPQTPLARWHPTWYRQARLQLTPLPTTGLYHSSPQPQTGATVQHTVSPSSSSPSLLKWRTRPFQLSVVSHMSDVWHMHISSSQPSCKLGTIITPILGKWSYEKLTSCPQSHQVSGGVWLQSRNSEKWSI